MRRKQRTVPTDGKKVVYFEIDSFLPIRDAFEYMCVSSYKKADIMGEGFHPLPDDIVHQISRKYQMYK